MFGQALATSPFPCGSPIAFFLRPAHALRNASSQRSPWAPILPVAAPATMAATNKCLAQSNKSAREPKATKKREIGN